MRGKRIVKVALFIYFSLFLVSFPLKGSEYIDIPSIQAKIEDENLSWTAGENEIFSLGMEQLKRLCGTRTDDSKDRKDISSKSDSGKDQSEDLPRVFDWRNYHGVNFISVIKKQQCGDDWAFAAIAALEAKVMIENGQNIDLSEQILVSDTFGYGDCKGGDILPALKSLVTTGSPIEQCCPYDALNKEKNSFICPNWSQKTYRFKMVAPVESQPDKIKQALYYNGPLLVTMNVYGDFASYKGGIYQHVTGDYIGKRSVLLVGYNDIDQFFIAKNSWGSTWGESGFFRISYEEMDSKSHFGRSAFRFSDKIDHHLLQNKNPLFPENIQSNTSVKGIFLSEDQWVYYKINLPATASVLKVRLTNGAGDADLYVKYGMLPSKSNYDRRPFKKGNRENVLIRYPFPGYYYIGIHAQQAVSDAVLFAEYLDTDIRGESKVISEIHSGKAVQDITGAYGQWVYYKIYVPKGNPHLIVKMKGGKGDADLYVKYNIKPSLDSFDTRPYKWGNNEIFKIQDAVEGYYYIGLRGYHSFSDVQLMAEIVFN